MNFNIIEQNWTEEFYKNYPDIKQDLVGGMPIKDIKKKYGLTEGRWLSYRKELINEGVITKKKAKRKGRYTPKNYSYNHGFYQVQKWKNGGVVHIASFKRECDAQKCVQLMRECNWDLNEISRIKKEIHP